MTTGENKGRAYRAPLTVLLLVGLLAGVGACGKKAAEEGAATGGQLSQAEVDTLLAGYAKDRAETQEWLQSSPTSYLAAVQRRDFGSETSLTVGRDPGNDVRIDDPAFKPHHLKVTVVGDSFLVEAVDGGARFRVKDDEMTAATLPPSRISVDRFSLRLSHQRFPAIIVFDPKSPRYAEYKGIPYFPPDVSYRVVAALKTNPNPDTTIIESTRGNRRRAIRIGWFDFTIDGKDCRLAATRLLEPGVGEKDFSLFFTDATTGKESYKVGRYLGAEPLPDGRYVLDFNYCYSPACAYSNQYNCPIPPSENRLDVAIRAGEMAPGYMH